jgi:hypothetical protein
MSYAPAVRHRPRGYVTRRETHSAANQTWPAGGDEVVPSPSVVGDCDGLADVGRVHHPALSNVDADVVDVVRRAVEDEVSGQ